MYGYVYDNDNIVITGNVTFITVCMYGQPRSGAAPRARLAAAGAASRTVVVCCFCVYY